MNGRTFFQNYLKRRKSPPRYTGAFFTEINASLQGLVSTSKQNRVMNT